MGNTDRLYPLSASSFELDLRLSPGWWHRCRCHILYRLNCQGELGFFSCELSFFFDKRENDKTRRDLHTPYRWPIFWHFPNPQLRPLGLTMPEVFYRTNEIACTFRPLYMKNKPPKPGICFSDPSIHVGLQEAACRDLTFFGPIHIYTHTRHSAYMHAYRDRMYSTWLVAPVEIRFTSCIRM